jgi:hypothetical protein
MIVHLKSSLWQVRKARFAKFGGNCNDSVGFKELERQEGEKQRGGTQKDH